MSIKNSIKKVYFVFVNYNDAPTTISCIKSIENITKSECDISIIIVDNASDKKDIENLRLEVQKRSNIELILSEKNHGYFGGLNLGLSKVIPDENQFVVIGNNDILYPENFLFLLSENKDKIEQYAVISPDIVTMDGVHQNPHVVHSISVFREIMYDLYFTNYYLGLFITKIARLTNKFTDRDDEKQYEIPQTIYQGYGACYILTPMFFEHFTQLWAPTFLMGEELFLSKQLEEKNLKIFYEPAIKVTHSLHASTEKIPGKKKWEISRKAHRVYRKYVNIWS